MDRTRLVEDLKRHEGFRSTPYKCPSGYWTLGYGRSVDERNGGGVSEAEAEVLLHNDVQGVYGELMGKYQWFTNLDDIRQNVLVMMAFQLGMGGLAEFPSMLRAVERAVNSGNALEKVGNFRYAYDEMLWKDPDARKPIHSDWWTQEEPPPNRAVELAEAMRTGEALA